MHLRYDFSRSEENRFHLKALVSYAAGDAVDKPKCIKRARCTPKLKRWFKSPEIKLKLVLLECNAILNIKKLTFYVENTEEINILP